MIAGLIPLVASCVSPPLRLAAVGPAPAQGARSPGPGSLQVFTETREHDDDGVYYFPHSGYQIYSSEGKRVRYIWNHHTFQEEDPTVVTLPAGHYLVDAEAELCGRVAVPVVIKPGQTTRVVLQPGWKPAATTSPAELVKSPEGYFIGWRADLTRNP